MLRNRGYTTWMLKSALHNPKVFIVCKDGMSMNYVSAEFREMVNDINNESMMTLGRNILGLYDEWPKFTIMNRVELSIRGYEQHIPVIFDNSCFY